MVNMFSKVFDDTINFYSLCILSLMCTY